MAPLGTRMLAGLVVKTHSDPPRGPARDILRLLDEEPALDEELLNLGRWIAGVLLCAAAARRCAR